MEEAVEEKAAREEKEKNSQNEKGPAATGLSRETTKSGFV